MTVDALTSCWRSISLRIFLLSTKLYLVAYVTLFQAARPSDLTFVRRIQVVTTILSALVAFWNIVWITGLFSHSLRVHLIFHAVEIAVLSFTAAFSEFWPIAVTGILLSAILLAVKFGDALSTSPHSAILREQFTLFHQTPKYDEPPGSLCCRGLAATPSYEFMQARRSLHWLLWT
ncbi:hypothetical protein DL96DRAFT_1625789 [Flagelloscypha sp. PMI_526]|nr:hypothetical protein DL96DRAFT_1625789 [Flagelloscypha sp. PMI_526]